VKKATQLHKPIKKIIRQSWRHGIPPAANSFELEINCLGHFLPQDY